MKCKNTLLLVLSLAIVVAPVSPAMAAAPKAKTNVEAAQMTHGTPKKPAKKKVAAKPEVATPAAEEPKAPAIPPRPQSATPQE